MIPTYHKGQRCYGTGYDMMSRIEQLEERLEAATDDAKEAETYAEELEAKLAKAVEALRFYAWDNEIRLPSDGPWGAGSTDFGKFARATLAELTGGKNE